MAGYMNYVNRNVAAVSLCLFFKVSVIIPELIADMKTYKYAYTLSHELYFLIKVNITIF